MINDTEYFMFGYFFLLPLLSEVLDLDLKESSSH
jgi:hypothetical protein